jgi:hypothetical protein
MRQASIRLVFAAIVAGMLSGAGGLEQAQAQPQGTTGPQKPRVIIIEPPDMRAPPRPPERPIDPPRSGREISPPMERPEPLPRMLPRVGN